MTKRKLLMREDLTDFVDPYKSSWRCCIIIASIRKEARLHAMHQKIADSNHSTSSHWKARCPHQWLSLMMLARGCYPATVKIHCIHKQPGRSLVRAPCRYSVLQVRWRDLANQTTWLQLETLPDRDVVAICDVVRELLHHHSYLY